MVEESARDEDRAVSPTWKLLKEAIPVACVLVLVLVPTVGRVQVVPSSFATMKLLVLAPESTSPATKLKVAL